MAFENQKYAAYDCFNGNSPYSKSDQDRTNQNTQIHLKTTLPYNNIK